jgi:hypothetical protein
MPGQPVVLETLGGLVSTARPEDVPEGASPRTYDTDFIVGRVIQRAGQQNVYSYSANFFGPNNPGTAANVATEGNPWLNPDNLLADDGAFATCIVVSPLTTDNLKLTNYNFTAPSTSAITGIEVPVKGYAPNATVFAQLLKAGVAVGAIRSAKLPTTNGVVTLGGPADPWGASWTYSDIDETEFGAVLWVVSASPATIALDGCPIKVYGSEAATNYNGLLSVDLDSTDQTTLALDALGLMWQEDVTNNPNVLVRAGLIPSVTPGSYLKGVDANGIAYMAFSDLTQGTSQPMQYNGQWCDRITQVGPGQAPVFTPQQASTDTFAISTITQPAQKSQGSSYFLQSSGVGSTTAGNNITVYYLDSTVAPGPDAALVAAFNSGNAVYLYMEFTGSGIPTQGPYVVQVTSIGLASPPGQPRKFYYFTYTLPTSAYQYYQGSGHTSYTVTYQQSLATLTASAPIPGLAVNNQIVISGATPSAWDGTWTITEALNSGAVSITQTSVASSVATYDYVLISGTAPSAGQLVTITGTLNANGGLNGANLVIDSSTGGSSGSFTINVSLPDASAVAEAGQGTTAGTIFCFDPGAADVGSSTDPIFGNATVGGSLTFSAAPETFITAGIKQGTAFFITRDGAVTFPANPVKFTIPANTQSIAATQIPVGPPNIAFVGITFTESGQNGVPGGSFYTYDTPVTFSVNGINYTASALIVPNGTTSANFSFPDSVLLASDEIDIQGNNYFNLIEIGNPVWMFQYATRMMFGLCQTKVQNFLNLSFDGGYLPGPSPLPLGWSNTGPIADLSMGLVVSPDFGNSLQVLNTGSSTITDTPLLYQNAYQDFYGVNILQPNTAYSARFKGRALNADGQQITLSLRPYASGAFGDAIASATFTVNQGGFTIQISDLLGALPTIPPTLQLVIEATSITAGAGFQIDRIEPFPTERPVDTTTIWTSYVGKFESVDGVTGQLGCGADNSQPTQGAYQILEQLYIEKTRSCCVTQDSPNYEPNQWNVPLSSQGAGSVGPNAFYSDEEFSIKACRPGLYLFDGGKPMPISRELQSTGVSGSVWETINWAATKTIWTRFSTDKRQLYVGVPMITPNFWLPNAATSTPTEPNVILMCNFTGCPTAQELAEALPVHTTMFGDLKSLDMRRKWSIWQIASPVGEFVTRQDGVSQPLFLCNGISSSKIYQLVDGAASGGQNTDDGQPINWLYTTYAFTQAKQGQQIPGLGALRKVWYYMTATMEGVGKVARKFYSNTLGALPQNTYTAPAATLSSPAQHNQECVLEIGGTKLFVEFSAVGTGGYAEIGNVILDGELDKNSPHRGVSA